MSQVASALRQLWGGQADKLTYFDVNNVSVVCVVFVVLFVPLVFADVRVMGPFGFVVLFLVPFVGFTLITTFLDVFGERFGRAPLGTAIVMGGILANLVACTLTFAG